MIESFFVWLLGPTLCFLALVALIMGIIGTTAYWLETNGKWWWERKG